MLLTPESPPSTEQRSCSHIHRFFLPPFSSEFTVPRPWSKPARLFTQCLARPLIHHSFKNILWPWAGKEAMTNLKCIKMAQNHWDASVDK